MADLTTKAPLIYGKSIPVLGFGTYLSTGDECYNAVRHALKTGYRHVDTAAFYRNENLVGAAIRDSGIKREDVFVTTKLWNTDQGYDSTLKAFEKSLTALNLDYVDLYLIHWPIPTGHAHDYRQLNADSWRAMLRLKNEGVIKSLGVSNFLPQHIDELMTTTDSLPEVNQIEMHPGLNQTETVEYCKSKGIVVEAWRPVLKGGADNIPAVKKIANKRGVTSSQICLSWLLHKGVVPLPKSVTPSRIEENANVFGITLSESEIAEIDNIPEIRLGSHPLTLNK